MNKGKKLQKKLEGLPCAVGSGDNTTFLGHSLGTVYIPARGPSVHAVAFVEFRLIVEDDFAALFDRRWGNESREESSGQQGSEKNVRNRCHIGRGEVPLAGVRGMFMKFGVRRKIS